MTQTSEEELDRLLAEKSLYEFVLQAWPQVEAVPFVDNWHVGAVCEHLEAVARGDIPKLLINVPPGCGKSLLVSVFWMCWEWLNDPSIRWFYASYDQRLSTRDSVKCRSLLTGPWYRGRWGDRFKLTQDQNQKTYFENEHGGFRLATSVGGHGLGQHPDRIVVDDPHSPRQACSEKERQTDLDWWDQTMSTRGVVRNVRRVIIMQRLHQEDLSGHVLAQGGWEHLVLPMRYESGRMKTTSLGWTDPRTSEGDLLAEKLFPEEAVQSMERSLGSMGTAGQLQQRPAPAEGVVFKRSNFRYFTDDHTAEGLVITLGHHEEGKPPPRKVRVGQCRWFQCIDTALKVNEGNAYTCVGTFGVTPWRDLLVWHVWRERLEVPEQFGGLMQLRAGQAVFNPQTRAWDVPGLANPWPFPILFQAVESMASGIGLIQQGALVGQYFRELKAVGSKETRALIVATMYENGKVYHRNGQGWLARFEDELLVFPSGKYRDQVDVASYGGIAVTQDALLRSGIDGPLMMVPPEPGTVGEDEKDEPWYMIYGRKAWEAAGRAGSGVSPATPAAAASFDREAEPKKDGIVYESADGDYQEIRVRGHVVVFDDREDQWFSNKNGPGR